MSAPVFEKSPDTVAFRRAMGMFPTGVAVLTAGRDAATVAMTANAVVSISLDPMLVLISIGESGRLRGAIESTGGFAVNVLAADQRPLSDLFARRDRPTGHAAQDVLGSLVGDTGVALVRDAVVSLECETYRQYPGGDHVLFLGRVAALHSSTVDREPLLFHQGGYSSLKKDWS
ncbi:nitrilotriacetate monooxygenase [Lentzea sp. NBRC 105346]|uniref:flavin reductase family protein n=1 Tax=Lentzea sp. NBRC 105346 TaxID=3032205 RepID=UPI0024A30975|nr:flavin reductase family protein [Lentzea sp. NBRC 105346]GLZ32245.1 nitrilotriacetate monooxygenase [Lentzea sp. NBRC 105346]